LGRRLVAKSEKLMVDQLVATKVYILAAMMVEKPAVWKVVYWAGKTVQS